MKKFASALALAAAMTAPAAMAKVTIFDQDDLKVALGLTQDLQYDVRNFGGDRPDGDYETVDGPVDVWDHEVDLDFYGYYGNWTTHLNFEITTLQDDSNSKIGDEDKPGQIEIEKAYVDYKGETLFRVGRWEHQLGAFQQFYDEGMTGVMFGRGFGAGKIIAGFGTDNDNGASFDEDRTLGWLELSFKNGFYAYNAMHWQGDDHLNNLGVGYKGKIGGVGLKAEGAGQYGQDDAGDDYSGYALLAEASFGNAEVLFAYGTGDDDDGEGGYKAREGDFKPDVLLVNEILGERVENLMMLRGQYEFSVGPKTSVTPGLGWYQLVEDNEANGETDLGIEIDVVLDHEVNKYVSFYGEVGYVLAGSALEELDGGQDDNPYLVQIGTVMKF